MPTCPEELLDSKIHRVRFKGVDTNWGREMGLIRERIGIQFGCNASERVEGRTVCAAVGFSAGVGGDQIIAATRAMQNMIRNMHIDAGIFETPEFRAEKSGLVITSDSELQTSSVGDESELHSREKIVVSRSGEKVLKVDFTITRVELPMDQ